MTSAEADQKALDLLQAEPNMKTRDFLVSLRAWYAKHRYMSGNQIHAIEKIAFMNRKKTEPLTAKVGEFITLEEKKMLTHEQVREKVKEQVNGGSSTAAAMRKVAEMPGMTFSKVSYAMYQQDKTRGATFKKTTSAEAIQLAKELRAQGLNYEDIAHELTKQGYRTIRGTKPTHGTAHDMITGKCFAYRGEPRPMRRRGYTRMTTNKVNNVVSQIKNILGLDVDSDTKISVITAIVG